MSSFNVNWYTKKPDPRIAAPPPRTQSLFALYYHNRRHEPDDKIPPPPIQVANVTWSNEEEEDALTNIRMLQDYQYTGLAGDEEGGLFVEDLLDIFEKYPEMPFVWVIWKELPLIHILQQGPYDDLDSNIKRFQRICGPKNFVQMLETHNGRNYYPIHAACKYSTGGIIEYILEQNPGAMHYTRAGNGSKQDSPLKVFLNRNNRNLKQVSDSTWRILIDLDPKEMRYCYNIFGKALSTDCSLDLFEFMLDRYPIESSPKIFMGPCHENFGRRKLTGETLSLKQVEILCNKALPRKLQSLELFCYKEIEEEGLRLLMGTLSAGSSSLKHLGLRVVVPSGGDTCPEDSPGGVTCPEDSPLLPGLGTTTSLESLELRFAEAPVSTVQSWFHGLRDAVVKLKELKRVKLYFNFKNQDPSSKTLYDLSAYGQESSEEEAKSSSGITSHDLDIENFDICDEEMVKLVNQQICFFGSSMFRIVGYARKDVYSSNPNLAGHITRFLTLLSSTNKKLEKLDANFCLVEMPAFLAYLKTNNTIKVFRQDNEGFDIDDSDYNGYSDYNGDSDGGSDEECSDEECNANLEYDVDAACIELLKNGNVTLTEFYPWRNGDSLMTWKLQDGEMAYYLDLNRLGRGKARKATWGELVDLLCGVTIDKYHGPLKTDKYDWGNRWILGNLYGLLREAPGHWAPSSTVCGKRKGEAVTTTASTSTKKPSTATSHVEPN